jgi:hypothetical protein
MPIKSLARFWAIVNLLCAARPALNLLGICATSKVSSQNNAHLIAARVCHCGTSAGLVPKLGTAKRLIAKEIRSSAHAEACPDKGIANIGSWRTFENLAVNCFSFNQRNEISCQDCRT